MTNSLFILGAGGHAKVVADAAEASGKWRAIELYDDAWPTLSSSGSWPVVGNTQKLFETKPSLTHQVIVGIGNNVVRQSLQEKLEILGWSLATVIHPAATVSTHSTIEPGSVVMAGAIVNIGAIIGKGCIVNTRASIDHDCVLGEAVHISPGAVLSGTVAIGEQTWVGAGAVVINNTNIGSRAMIGAGAAVVSSIPSDVVAYGNPAKVIKELP